MIVLKDLITTLITGPYSNTIFSGTSGELSETHYSKVATLINLGLLEIYKRFKFLENELVLHVVPDVTKYYLRSDRTVILANISETKYIEANPTVDGFLNIIRLTAAYDSDGTEIRLNHPHVYNPNDITTPAIIQLATDIVQITNVFAPKTISLVYQSYPTKVTEDDFYYPEGRELSLPDIAIDPLVSFIAAKTFKPMGANDSTANADKSNSYEQMYELACQKIDMYGLDLQDTTERDTFVSNGWV